MASRNTGKSVKMSIPVEGAEHIKEAFRDLPDTAKNTLRQQGTVLASGQAAKIRARAEADSAQSRLIAPSIRAGINQDFPAVMVGGSGHVAGHADVQYSDVVFGAEFGGKKTILTQQFRPHKGKQGYFLFPQMREDAQDLIDAYVDAIDRVLDGMRIGERT